MVSNAVSPLQAELRQAKVEIAAVKGVLALTTASSTKALQVSQGTLSLVQRQTTDLQEQRDKDLEFKRLLFSTMKDAGLAIPPEGEDILASAPPPTKRRPPPAAGF